MTAGNCNVEGLPVRATARLDIGGLVINAGTLGTVSLQHKGNYAVVVSWVGAPGVWAHSSLDNIVIHRH